MHILHCTNSFPNPKAMTSRRIPLSRSCRDDIDPAAALAREHGLHTVTADAIAARADVSTRTFHNYLAGKEEAIPARGVCTVSPPRGKSSPPWSIPPGPNSRGTWWPAAATP